MPSVTIAVPPELKRRMDAIDTVNWSGVARHAIERHLAQLEAFHKLTENSKMTQKDALELGRIVNEGVAKRYREDIERLRKAGKMPPRIDEVQGPRLIKFLSTWQNQGFP